MWTMETGTDLFICSPWLVPRGLPGRGAPHEGPRTGSDLSKGSLTHPPPTVHLDRISGTRSHFELQRKKEEEWNRGGKKQPSPSVKVAARVDLGDFIYSFDPKKHQEDQRGEDAKQFPTQAKTCGYLECPSTLLTLLVPRKVPGAWNLCRSVGEGVLPAGIHVKSPVAHQGWNRGKGKRGVNVLKGGELDQNNTRNEWN